MFNKLSYAQKKWLSLTVAIILVCFASLLTGCGNKEAEEALAQQKAANEAAAIFLKQGDGKVRQWEHSPPSTQVKGNDDAKK